MPVNLDEKFVREASGGLAGSNFVFWGPPKFSPQDNTSLWGLGILTTAMFCKKKWRIDAAPVSQPCQAICAEYMVMEN